MDEIGVGMLGYAFVGRAHSAGFNQVVALGDIMSHVVDQARFLVGDIAAVAGGVRTFVSGRSVDDAAYAAVEFENGAVGTIEATRLATGRKNALFWEINEDGYHCAEVPDAIARGGRQELTYRSA